MSERRGNYEDRHPTDYTDEDMAAVGRAFMEAIDQARMVDPWVKDWSPSQCPSEIIFQLINQRDEAQELALKVAASPAIGATPMAEERHCPTCGDTDIILTWDAPIDGWTEITCKTCLRTLEIGRPGVGPLVDPLWVERHPVTGSDANG